MPSLRTLLVLAAVAATATPLAAQKSGSDLLVTPSWLKSHLTDPDLVILQIGERKGYDQEHIPGARFVELGDIDATKGVQGALILEMPKPDELRTRLEKLGISDGSRIVVVHAQEYYSPSTRVVITLQHAGFGDRTVWLDGGLGAWKAAGNPVTAEVPPARTGRITRTGGPSFLVDYAFVRDLPKTGSKLKLIDGRDAPSYNGPAHGHMKGGHIAGAATLPFNTLVGEDQRLLPKAELEAKFKAAGVEPGDTVVAYCHIGQYATLVLFAAQVLGHPIKFYDGSMDDWSRRDLPTEGAKP